MSFLRTNLKNSPSDASGTHVQNWASTYIKNATPENKPSTDTTNKTETTTKKDPVKTGDTTTLAAYIAMFVATTFGIILARRKRA